MPRAQVKVQGAANKTRWTLAKSTESTPTRQSFHVGVKEELEYLQQKTYTVDKETGAVGRMQASVGGQQQHQQQHQQYQQRAQQPNGLYFHDDQNQHLPRYSFDGSQYSEQSGRLSSQGPWKPLQNASTAPSRGVSGYSGFDFNMNTLDDPRASTQNPHRISVNTGLARNNPDAVTQHLLYETALMDSQTFEILSIAEVDALKKEHVRLNQKIEATQRKLALESKVRDAAQNLQRLYSTKNRPDTPQDPDSPKKSRHSLLSGRPRSSSRASEADVEHFQQADHELAASVKKVDELHANMKELLDRRQYVERKLLRHTSAVLAEEANKNAESAIPGLTNGRHGMGFDDDDEGGEYTPNEFDGIRDILRGMPAGASTKVQEHEQQLARMQERLEQLNLQLRAVIEEVGRTLGQDVKEAENGLDEGEDSGVRVENRFARLEDSLYILQRQQEEVRSMHERGMDEVKAQHERELGEATSLQSHGLNEVKEQHAREMAEIKDQHAQELDAVIMQHSRELDEVKTQHSQAQAQQDAMRDALEQQLENLNSQLYNALLVASESQAVPGLQQPPQATGQGYEIQMQYLEDNVMTMEQLLQLQHTSDAAQKLSEYETTIHGLWQILQPDTSTPRPSTYDSDSESESSPPTPLTPLPESFSLPAFSSLVQTVHDRAESAKDQHDILRRQIQQQRDLNGKSDAEKDREIATWQDKHSNLTQDHSAMQQELANWIVKQQDTEEQATQSRAELEKVMLELEALKGEIDTKMAERDEVARRMKEQVETLEARAQDHASTREEIDDLESEIVRLTTELTMTKAELDGAYGSRQERKGAQAAEVEGLLERNRLQGEQVSQLERELGEMTGEFQELTRESIELEKEREGLEGLIDGLRERVEMLEVQLGEEKLRWVGVRSPTTAGGDGGVAVAREGTSMMVLRQEFKKMMRDQRAEGLKLLRAEQEDRRRLESELRKLRQAGGPLGKKLESASGSVTPV